INHHWHWLYKHPVEFSKNNHTPTRSPTLSGTPYRGNRSNLLGRVFIVNLMFEAINVARPIPR
ncbi:hypothetical protein ACWDXH_20225, partial [Micromonospora chokoriensis]